MYINKWNWITIIEINVKIFYSNDFSTKKKKNNKCRSLKVSAVFMSAAFSCIFFPPRPVFFAMAYFRGGESKDSLRVDGYIVNYLN